jgi:hypothetical protein
MLISPLLSIKRICLHLERLIGYLWNSLYVFVAFKKMVSSTYLHLDLRRGKYTPCGLRVYSNHQKRRKLQEREQAAWIMRNSFLYAYDL